ncbi:MAG: hypothetical protein NZ519_08750 [Bacteroidia bacterium]|nr:hypothetical protein [Bacteroidia bacterium]
MRKVQVQDPVFMNDFAKFLHKNTQNAQNFVLYVDTEGQTAEEQYFEAKRISAFLSEHLVSNSLFHLHHWGILKLQEGSYIFDNQKIEQCFTLSRALVLTCIWQNQNLALSEVCNSLGRLSFSKVFIFPQNPHLNIRTQEHASVLEYPNEGETARILSQVQSVFQGKCWVSHLNNIRMNE